MGTAQEAEDTLSPKAGDADAPPPPPSPDSPAPTPPTPATASAQSTWSSVFNPGRNNNPDANSPGANQYDHVHAPADDPRSVWEEVIKAERVKTFAGLDRDADGFITAADLKAALGPGADVDQLIKAADKKGDGRVGYAEFSELLRNS